MTFLAPWASLFLAGVPIIVLLYLLKLKRRPVAVSTLMFWQRVMHENRRRALFQRLRNLLSLLLHLIIFLLIVAALAKPVLDHHVLSGSSTVLILDTRARMQAREPDGEPRFEKARRQAQALVREASASRQFALLTVDAAAQVAVPFTSDEKTLRHALDDASASDAAGELDTALALAEQILKSRSGDHRVVLITDTATPAPEEFRALLTVVPVGSSRENVAITRFATRPLLSSPQTAEVLLEVRNFGNKAARVNVELTLDGALLDVKPFELSANERRVEIFPSLARPTRAARGWLTARLDHQDALSVDNVAYAVFAAAPPRRVLLVSKGNWFLEKLLAADQQLQPELLGPDAFKPAMAGSFETVIFDNVVPPGFKLEDAGGNFLFLGASPFTQTGTNSDQPLITEQDAAHPLLRLVNLQNVAIGKSGVLKVPATGAGWSWETPLRSDDGPLLIAGRRLRGGQEQRMAVLGFELGASDLPLRVAFPLMMTNAVHWLAGGNRALGAAVRAGEKLELGTEQRVTPAPAVDPPSSGSIAASRPIGGSFIPVRNGFYELTSRSGGSEWLAVNTFSEAESNLLQDAAPISAPAPRISGLTLATFSALAPWRFLALAALTLSLLEWFLFHRRKTE